MREDRLQEWDADLARAYAVFGVDPLNHIDEFGLRFPRLSVAFLREKAERQLRDALGRWRRMRGRIAEDREGGPLDRGRLLKGEPVRNPGRSLSSADEERRWEINTGVAKRTKKGIEYIQGSPAGARIGKNWEKNGASWKGLIEAAKVKILEGVAKFAEYEPRSAKTIDEMKQNIVDAFNSASTLEFKYGERWYAEGKRRIEELAKTYDIDPHMVAAIIASTSPRTRWEQNIAAAELVIKSLDPRYSPKIDTAFLATNMGQKTGRQSILDNVAVMEEFAGPAPKKPKPIKGDPEKTKQQKEQYEKDLAEFTKKAKVLIEDFLDNAKNPDGSDLKIYQIQNRALRTALMSVNNRRLAAEDERTKTGMGIPYQLYTSDGYLSENYNHLSGVMVTQMAAVDTLYGYEKKASASAVLPPGWSGMASDPEDLYERIGNSLPGHKTRSFYNNLITGGESEESITIDVHATAAALVGKLATRTGVKIRNAEKLLSGESEFGGSAVNEGRIGSYAALHEAFRLATEEINANRRANGLPPLTGAQVQAIAWVATRGDSIAGELIQRTTNLRNPEKRDQRVMPNIEESQRQFISRTIMSLPKSGKDDLNHKRLVQAMNDEGIPTDWLTENEFKKIKYSMMDPWQEFNARKKSGAMRMGRRFMPAISWLLHTGGTTDDDIANRIREAFKTDKYTPKFDAEDVQLAREVLSDRYSMEELMSDELQEVVNDMFSDYNEARAAAGVTTKITHKELRELLRDSELNELG